LALDGHTDARNDGPSGWDQGTLNFSHSQAARLDTRVHRNYCGTDIRYGKPSRDKRVPGNDHFVPGADAPSPEHEFQRIQAGANRHGMLHAATRPVLSLERGNLCTQDPLTGR
jgi:hypothetical protein